MIKTDATQAETIAAPVDREGVVERLRAEALFFRQNRPVTENTSSTERLCDEAADLIDRLTASEERLREALGRIAALDYDDFAGNPDKWASHIARQALGGPNDS